MVCTNFARVERGSAERMFDRKGRWEYKAFSDSDCHRVWEGQEVGKVGEFYHALTRG